MRKPVIRMLRANMSTRAVTNITKAICLIGQRCHVGAKRMAYILLTLCDLFLGGTCNFCLVSSVTKMRYVNPACVCYWSMIKELNDK